MDDSLGEMACIGGDKLTKNRIRANRVFSANLVTQDLLPLADYYGTKNKYNFKKVEVIFKITQGTVLDIPVLADSPWSFQLEAVQETLRW